MHNTVKRIINKIKKLEKRELNEEQQKLLAALKKMLAFFQNKASQGLALTSDDETFLGFLEIVINYMVKDSSIT